MKRALLLFGGVLIVIIALAVISRMSGDDRSDRPQHIRDVAVEPTLVPAAPEREASQAHEQDVEEEGQEQANEAAYVQNGVQKAGNTTPLIEFDKGDYDYARAEGKKIALFFFADWCPSCRTEIAQAVIPAFNQLERDDVVGFLVNFDDRRTDDDEDALAREFQIPDRHAKLFLGADGSVIRKSAPENWTTQQYLDAIAAIE